MTPAPELKPRAPIVLASGQMRTPEPFNIRGQQGLLKLSGDDTGGNFAVFVFEAHPMMGPPLHVHARHDEWFYILSGELTFQLDDQRIVAGPGTSVFGPRGVPHTFQNFTDQTAKLIGMSMPSDMEDFFREATSMPVQSEAFERLMNRYGITKLGPPLSA
jgi:mannose-6-phosphate isomerase-like protein (cupin superfamily)